MTKAELFELIKKHSINYTSEWILRDAVEAYSSASNNGKPHVSGSLPLTDAEKLVIAWKTLEWVGFSKGVEFEDKDILEMLGGNDR